MWQRKFISRHVRLLCLTAVSMMWHQSVMSANKLCHLSVRRLSCNIAWTSIVHRCLNLCWPKNGSSKASCGKCKNYIMEPMICMIIWAATWQNQQCGCAPSEDSDQPGHPPSLISVFAVCLMGNKEPKLSSRRQRRLWSDWADAQADLSLRWAHSHFVGFVTSWLIC